MRAVAKIDDVEVFGQGRGQAREFTYKASAKQVEILVSRIYKDKVSAIIRELCCNAYDAHVATGRTGLKFKVQLPTSLDSRFVVRDFGPGLSQDQIETVYTQFFNSTKDESNDYIGALGLGCKSPFCMVDAYTVTSYQNGTMMCYTMFKQDGLLSFRAETPEPVPTDEPDGLEVAVPIPPGHYEEFKQKAALILFWFDNRPDVPELKETFNQFEKELFERIPDPEGDIIVLKAADTSHYNSGIKSLEGYGHSSYIRMGQVVYPVTAPFVNNRTHYKILVTVPIGSVDVQAGREELSYDDVTKEYLQERAKRVSERIQRHFSASVENCANIREAYVAVQKLRGSELAGDIKFKGFHLAGGDFAWPTSRFIVRAESVATKYNPNKSKNDDDDFDDDEDLSLAKEDILDCDDHDRARLFGDYRLAIQGDKIVVTATQDRHFSYRYGHNYDRKAYDALKNAPVELVYVLIDDDTNVSRRLTALRKKYRRKYANEFKFVSLILMRGGGHDYDFWGDRTRPLNADEVKQIRAVLDKNDTIVLTSELDVKDNQIHDVYKISRKLEIGYCNRRNWQVTTIPETGGGFYWPLQNGTLKHCAGKRRSSEWGTSRLDQTLTSILSLLKETYPEFGNGFLLVPESRLADLDDSWKSVPDVMMEILKTKLKDKRWKRCFVNSFNHYSMRHARNYAQGILKIFDKLDPKHPLRDLIDQAKFEEKNAADFKLFQHFLWLMDHKRFRGKEEERHQKIQQRRHHNHHVNKKKRKKTRFERLNEDYPLLFNGYGHHANVDDLAIYANAKFKHLKAEAKAKKAKAEAKAAKGKMAA